MLRIIQRFLKSPVFIFAAALGLRAAFALHQASLISREVLASVPFQNEAGNVAYALAHGQGFCCLFRQPSGPTAWLAPVYPLLLAAVFKLFGSFTLASFVAAVSLNCFFSASVVFPLFYAAQRIAGPVVAVTAAWLWAFFPSGIVLPFEWIWDTSLSALLGISLLWATLCLAERPRPRNFALYGILWGFALQTNPVLATLLPFFLVWLCRPRPDLARVQARMALLVLALAATVCLPWTLRNAVQFHRFIPLRSDLPFELWLGNNPIYDPDSREVNRITRFEQVHLYNRLGESEFLRQKSQAVAAFFRDHSGLALQLAAGRAVATWLGTSSPLEDFRRADSLFLRVVLFSQVLILAGTLAGLFLVAAGFREYALLLAPYPLVFPIIYYFTQASLRYRHPCDPVLALLMALAIGWLVQAVRQRFLLTSA